ncbi:MAG: hypothetical protein ACREMR_09560 [Gemmatimonadales bacterium]
MEPHGEQLVLLSAHNLLLVNTRDARQVYRHYPGPGGSFLSKLGKAALFVASAMSQAAASDAMARPGAHVTVTYDYNPFIRERVQGIIRAVDSYTFMYTKAPDRAGREGFSLVRLRKGDGKEAGRVWLDERAPEYVLDPSTAFVCFKRGTREIVALSFAAEP